MLAVTDVFELRHQPAARGVVAVRVVPLAIATGLLVVAVASAVALATQDLSSQEVLNAVFLVAVGAGGGCFVLYRTWRTWPAVSPSFVVMRLDGDGVRLRKGRLRDENWFGVPWSAIQSVLFTPIRDPRKASGSGHPLRVIRFVPHPTADVPPGPPGMYDAALGLPPRESVLAFVAARTWDEDIRELLGWVRRHRPELAVEDAVPVGQE